MKRIVSIFLCALTLTALLFSTVSCASLVDLIVYGVRKAPDIPEGYISKSEHMQKEGFQDFVDYCKFVYPEGTDIFEKDGAYKVLKAAPEPSEEDKEPVDGIATTDALFTSFEEFWRLDEERAKDYDFDHACISEGDLYRAKKITSLGNLPDDPIEGGVTSIDGYALWFFDKESSTLYYIRANT